MANLENSTNPELAHGRAVPLPAQSTNSEIDLLNIAITLARRKRIWLLFTIACTFIATVVSLLLPATYVATTTLLSPQQSQSSANMLMGQLGALAALSGKDVGLKNPGDLYAAMLQAERVESALVQRFDLQKVYGARKPADARIYLEKQTTVKSRKEGLITLTVTDVDPKRAADLANAYVDELSKLNQDLAVSEASQRRLFFEKQLQAAKENLATAEVALKVTQQETGLIQMDAQAKAIIETVANMKAHVAAKEVEIRALRSFATERNTDLILSEQQLAGMREQLNKLEHQQNGVGDLQVPTSNVPVVGLEYVRRVRDVKYYETIFELLAKQFEAAKLDEVKNNVVIQVVDPATVPQRRSGPSRLMIVLSVLFASAFLSMLYVLTVEALSQTFASSEKQARLALLKSYLHLGRK